MAKKIVEKISHLFNSKTKRPLPLCYAPFNNLLIDQQGCIKICCHNISYILGRFPIDRINDVWFGKMRQSITNQFLFDETPDSCNSCIKNGLNIDLLSTKTAYSKRKNLINFNQYPYQIDFLLDNNCNLDCIMCSSNISTSSTNTDVYALEKVNFNEDFFTQIKPFLEKGRFFVFGGGEPFLIQIYSKMWKYIYEKNSSATIYVQTNGTILTDQIKKTIEKYKINIGISIDSVNKENYEKIRRNASFEKTFENIEYFIQYSDSQKKNMTLMVTPMIINADEIPHIFEYANNNNLHFSLSILDRPVHLAIWSLPSKEIFKLIDKYKSFKFLTDSSQNLIKNNIKAFQIFILLVEKYARRKVFIEQHQQKILSQIIKLSEYFAENYETILKFSIENSSIEKYKKEAFHNRAKDLINQLIEKNATLFDNKLYLYSYFINKEMSSFVNNLINFDDYTISQFFQEKIYEHKIFFDTLSYDHIIDLDYYE